MKAFRFFRSFYSVNIISIVEVVTFIIGLMMHCFTSILFTSLLPGKKDVNRAAEFTARGPARSARSSDVFLTPAVHLHRPNGVPIPAFNSSVAGGPQTSTLFRPDYLAQPGGPAPLPMFLGSGMAQTTGSDMGLMKQQKRIAGYQGLAHLYKN
jgi:hypothetical protein